MRNELFTQRQLLSLERPDRDPTVLEIIRPVTIGRWDAHQPVHFAMATKPRAKPMAV